MKPPAEIIQASSPLVTVIIPAYNEAASIGMVLADIPIWVQEVLVIDNNSTDATTENARKAGATVLFEPKKGYGNACLCGMEYLASNSQKPDIVVFLDGDYSDFPREMEKIVTPISQENIDFVLGAREKSMREKGAMTSPQIFGNWLATHLMKLFFQAEYSDLGPFRAIKYEKLLALKMQDPTYGWTIEMQLKALRQNLSYREIAVPYRNRIGKSKVSGTFKGAFMAGIKILGWIFIYGFKKDPLK